MIDLSYLNSKLETLEQLLQKAWNDDVERERLSDGLEQAVSTIRDVAYAYASITAVAIRREEEVTPVVRAVVMEDPGMAPRLFLQHIVYGAEDSPINVKKSVEVQQRALCTIDNLRFEGNELLFTADPDDEAKEYAVVATNQRLGTDAVARA